MVSPVADFVVAMGSDGRILSQGSLASALERDSELLKEITEERAEIEKAEQEVTTLKPEAVEATKITGKLVVAEEMEDGHVGWTACEYHHHFVHAKLAHGMSQSNCTSATCQRGRYCSGSYTCPIKSYSTSSSTSK